jgi:aminoglycoside phosphotransferase family enzyme/predicted kinase
MEATPLATLVRALQDPARYPHPVGRVEVLETHISFVLLAGEYAYKLKKPLDLGFLDFSTLEARQRYCEEELRLNRRTAPDLYLAVLPIKGRPEDPQFGGDGDAIEYAVKMRRFPQEALLDRMAKAGTLQPGHIDALASSIAAFHDRVAVAAEDTQWGAPGHVLAPAFQNFTQLAPRVDGAGDRRELEALHAWTQREYDARREAFSTRKRDGRVRECHGDLHLGNIALIGGAPVPFDCIEFEPELRWIDVMNEVAFLVMDLLDRGFGPLAWRFLDRYLQATGDYAGMPVMRFYMVYRALVRAKVAAIRAGQEGLAVAARNEARAKCREYLSLATALSRAGHPALVATHGVSGSGKTFVASRLVERLGAIRVRSDVERKRLHGLAAEARTSCAFGNGLYGPASTEATYRRLEDVARVVLQSGWPVIVDAASLRRTERDRFRALAGALGVPFVIASCTAPPEVLRERVVARERQGRDASEAGLDVLERQLTSQEPIAADEQADTVVFDSAAGAAATETTIEALVRRIGA